MRRFGVSVISALLVLGFTGASVAGPLSARDARKLLYRGDAYRAEMIAPAGLDPVTQIQVNAIFGAMSASKVASEIKGDGYYGAVAVVPDEPLSQKTMAVSTKLHSPAAAQAAAINECNRLSPRGSTGCVAVILILPKRYKNPSFTLSQAATDRFRGEWNGGQGPKYLAYSPSSQAWALVKGDGAADLAVSTCNDQAADFGVRDCVIAIAEN